MVKFAFDSSSVTFGGGFDPIPAGNYVAHIISAEKKKAKANPDNEYLALTWEVIEGDFAHCRIWQNLNIINQNIDAERIAKSQLKQITDAVGLQDIYELDTDDIEFKTLNIGVVIRTDDPTYGPKNEVKRVSRIDGAATAKAPSPSSPQSAATQQQAATQSGTRSGKKPWDLS